jgi:hypothetical protein
MTGEVFYCMIFNKNIQVTFKCKEISDLSGLKMLVLSKALQDTTAAYYRGYAQSATATAIEFSIFVLLILIFYLLNPKPPMKRNFYAIAAMLLFSASIISCKKETPVTATNNALNQETPAEGRVAIQQSASSLLASNNHWIVGSCIYNGQIQTENYKEYEFQFEDLDQLIAEKEKTTSFGQWNLPDPDHLVIEFQASELSNLNENWTIVSMTETSIQLSMVNYLKELRLDLKPDNGAIK